MVIQVSTTCRWEAREPGEMDLAELHVCKRADGSDWVLGQGTFGTVRVCCRWSVPESIMPRHGCGGAT